ncbi:MAG: DUF4190 domain-containing protein [Gordonia sp. (in: high G+C Gram-positive bacteria)]
MSHPYDPRGQGPPPAGGGPPGYPQTRGYSGQSPHHQQTQINPLATRPPTPTTAPPGPFAGTPPYAATGVDVYGNPVGAPPPGGPVGPAPGLTTNPLAVPALVTAFLVAPIGIILGHLSLAQINRRREDGRPIAIAALAVGYLLTLAAIVGLVLALIPGGPFDTTRDDPTVAATTPTVVTTQTTTTTTTTTTSYPTYSSPSSLTFVDTVTTPPGYTPNPGDSIANTIRTTGVGGCLHKETTGTTIDVLYRASCSSQNANYRVLRRTDVTTDCAGGDWVRTRANSYYNRDVVLCLEQL